MSQPPSFGSDGNEYLPKLSDGQTIVIKILKKPETYMDPEYGLKYQMKIKVLDGMDECLNHVLLWSSISGALKQLYEYMEISENNVASCMKHNWNLTGKASPNNPNIIKYRLVPQGEGDPRV
jgi:hypothetical protein